jgi:formiminotetrahydrofolate cyclodeaminase
MPTAEYKRFFPENCTSIADMVGNLERENARLQNMVDTMAEQLEQRPEVDPELQTNLNRLLDLIQPDVEAQESIYNAQDKKTTVIKSQRILDIINLFRWFRPKEGEK